MILNRTYEPPEEVDQYTSNLLKALAKLDNLIDTPHPIISIATFQQGWSKIKERTSAGISGIHFRHLKACVRSQTLSDFEATILYILYITGYSPTE